MEHTKRVLAMPFAFREKFLEFANEWYTEKSYDLRRRLHIDTDEKWKKYMVRWMEFSVQFWVIVIAAVFAKMKNARIEVFASIVAFLVIFSSVKLYFLLQKKKVHIKKEKIPAQKQTSATANPNSPSDDDEGTIVPTAEVVPDMVDAFAAAARDENRTGYLANLTKQQRIALDEIKYIMYKSPYADYLMNHRDGDRFILRFARATMKDKSGERIFDVKACEHRMMASLKWRKEHGVFDMDMNKPPEKWDLYQKVRPIYQFRDSRTGRLVNIERFALFTSYVNTNCMKWDEWEQCLVYHLEKDLLSLHEQSEKFGYEISTVVNIMDNRGQTLGVMTKGPFMQLVNDSCAKHYPEMVKNFYIVGAPRIFSMIWRAFEKFLDDDTRNKISINSEIPSFEQFDKIIDASLLPVEYNGKTDILVGRCSFAPQLKSPPL